jgi:hypothetical protein
LRATRAAGESQKVRVHILNTFPAMRSLSLQWLMHKRTYRCMEPQTGAAHGIITHFGLLIKSYYGIKSHIPGKSWFRAMVESSESSAISIYAAIRRNMHHPLSDLSTHLRKRVHKMNRSAKAQLERHMHPNTQHAAGLRQNVEDNRLRVAGSGHQSERTAV